ncbi:MAG TPA: hypothetical protein VFB31_07105 [Pseudolabrys sp.]|nr:hypothetical protein [Pseudolabrys sp.]
MLFPTRSLCATLTAAALLFGIGAAGAESGPFSEFNGHWSGTGTLKPSDKPAERIRCDATYRALGSTGHQIDLALRCDSDDYKFDLSGQFQADDNNHVSGSFTERTRGTGGTVVGTARGPRLQIHVEGAGFSATMVATTRGGSQSVSIDGSGGGQFVKASITLRRGG